MLDVSKLAPIAKTVVAVCGSFITIIMAVSAIVATATDGQVDAEDMNIIFANIVVILTALGIPIAVYKVPNKDDKVADVSLKIKKV